MTAGLYYADFSDEEAVAENVDRDYTYYGVSARYNYPLSTYWGLCWCRLRQTKGDALAGQTSDYKDQVTQVYCGLTHTF